MAPLFHHFFTYSTKHLMRNIVFWGCSILRIQSLKWHDKRPLFSATYSTMWATSHHHNNDDKNIMMRASMLMRTHTYKVCCVPAGNTVLVALQMWTFSIVTTPGVYYFYPREMTQRAQHSLGPTSLSAQALALVFALNHHVILCPQQSWSEDSRNSVKGMQTRLGWWEKGFRKTSRRRWSLSWIFKCG